ncbi:unnamed protein product [Anisakis simplex]|uniref:Uncharacterized protein n=1 Tax=Anisakis simplex TaxID=6269 RepID=A0A0M3KD20_ANISI|nr:unnamed protein product [Anisakis simplex]
MAYPFGVFASATPTGVVVVVRLSATFDEEEPAERVERTSFMTGLCRLDRDVLELGPSDADVNALSVIRNAPLIRFTTVTADMAAFQIAHLSVFFSSTFTLIKRQHSPRTLFT